MSNVLIISSSPRANSTTDIICNAVAEGARNSGHRVVKFNIAGMSIENCKACEVCHSGNSGCCLNDDMEKTLAEYAEADVLVLATPVYFWNMSGLLKNWIDRTYSIYRKQKIKKTVLIAASAGNNPAMFEPIISGYKGYVACMRGPKDCGILTFSGEFNTKNEKSKEILNKAYEIGEKF